MYKERWPNEAVFRAEAMLGSEVVPVVVKFTHAHGAHAHALLADASLAPAPRHYAYEDDVGMRVVVMDCVAGGARADWTALSPGCAASLSGRRCARCTSTTSCSGTCARRTCSRCRAGGGATELDADEGEPLEAGQTGEYRGKERKVEPW